MAEEESWAPMKPLIRELSGRRIAQVWLHHANDLGKSFGTKTREWEMDTVAALTRPLDEEGQADQEAIRLEFRKARLRTPANADQFQPLIIRPGDVFSNKALTVRASSSAAFCRAALMDGRSRTAVTAFTSRIATGFFVIAQP